MNPPLPNLPTLDYQDDRLAGRRRTTIRRIVAIIVLKLVMVAANTAMLFVNVPPFLQIAGIGVQLLLTGAFFALLFRLLSLPQRRAGDGE